MAYWILQHNTKLLSDDCAHPPGVQWNRDYWNISRYASDVNVGGTAFIWHSGSAEQRGVYDVATIVSVPPHSLNALHQIELLQQSDAPCWTDVKKRDQLRGEPSILIERQYQNGLQPPILLAELVRQGFGNLPVIRMPQSGIYRLDDAVGQNLLNHIWQTRGRE